MLERLAEEQKALKSAFANANELLYEELLSNSIIGTSFKAALLVEELLATLTKSRGSAVEKRLFRRVKAANPKGSVCF